MERLVVTVKDSTIQSEHLPEEIQVSKEDERTMVLTLGRSLQDIEREVILTGPLSEEQRTRLLDIANKCPVHRTLTSEIRIESWLG